MFKTIAYAMPSRMISKLAKDLKAGGYDVTKDADTMVAKHGDKVIARAMKMRTVWCLRGDTDYIVTLSANA